MKNFNQQRYCQMLKWNILTNRKTMLTHTLAFVAAFLLLQLFYIGMMNMFRSPSDDSIMLAMGMCLSTAIMLGTYYASGLLGNAQSKEQRTTMMLVPATTAEKYAARLTYTLVVIPLYIVAALIVATMFRMAIQLAVGHENIRVGLDLVMDSRAHSVLNNMLGYVYLVSVFVLGGALFRKHPYIWTWVSLIVIFMCIGIVVGLVCSSGAKGRSLDISIPEWIDNTVFGVLTVLNFIGSYRLFSRLQVVQHKWFNI